LTHTVHDSLGGQEFQMTQCMIEWCNLTPAMQYNAVNTAYTGIM